MPGTITREAEKRPSVEWPTLALAVVIYGGWFALTLSWMLLPTWLVLLLGAWLIAWHGSLQHEVIHGHPAAAPWLGTLIGMPPLALWLPYQIYRADHLTHHIDENLTDPRRDPESYYATREDWAAMSPPMRAFRMVLQTMAGRFLFGPGWAIGRFLWTEAGRLLAGDPRSDRRAWLIHVPLVGLVVWWVLVHCAMPVWLYLAIVYVGTGLTMMRSYFEHRATELPGHRIAVVENVFPFGILFLFNNLHAAHHAKPGLPWYRLPAFYRANRDALLAGNAGFFFPGYMTVARRHLIRPNFVPVHPTL